MKKNRSITLFFSILFTVGMGFAAVKGPRYNGLRSMGMGNTTVAVTTDRTAIFHNPAGLSLLKDKIDVSISPLIFAIDGKFFTLIDALVQQGGKLSDINDIDADFIDMINNLDGDWVGFRWIPEVTCATKNLGFGFYTVLPVGVRIESGHLIPKLGLRGQRDLVFTWAVGVPLKAKNTHMGISVEYLQRTPLDERITTYSETFQYFDDMSGISALGVIGDVSEVQHGVSFDIGMMHNWKGFRLAYDIKDILGVIGGKLVVPPRFDLGCAYYFPQMENVQYIDNLILAFEFSDILGVEPKTEKYEHPVKKLHFGAELDLKYAAIRLGLNQGYPTAGLGIRLGLFTLDYVFFIDELGYYPGQLARKSHVLSMGIAFKAKRPEKREKEDYREDYDESMYEDSPVKKVPPKEAETAPVQAQEEPVTPAPAVPVEEPVTTPEEPSSQEETPVEQEQESTDEGVEATEESETTEESEVTPAEEYDVPDETEETDDESSEEEESIGWE